MPLATLSLGALGVVAQSNVRSVMRGFWWKCAFLGSLLLAGCDTLGKRVEKEIRKAAVGHIPDPTEVIEEDPILVNSILPSRGMTTGGDQIEIVGLNFEQGMVVFFGAIEAGQSLVVDSSRIEVATPAAPIGFADVFVVDPQMCEWSNNCSVPSCCLRWGVLELGFEFYEPVLAHSIAPNRGPTVGGVDVIIEGAGFVDGTQVLFGNSTRVSAIIIHSGKLVVTQPPLPRDVYAVTVTNYNGSSTLPAAYTTWAPVHIDSVMPFMGPLTGGTAVVVSGTGFVNPTALRLGSANLSADARSDEAELAAVTEPAAIEGSVDVAVENENGAFTASDAFVFIDESNTAARVVSIAPATGLVDGGRVVRIAGVGFAVDMTVSFAGIAANCDVLSSNAITCMTPAAREGYADVRVRGTDIDLTIPDGFKYILLDIEAVVPNEGSLAGNTYVELFGSGFGADTQVFFNDAPARNIKVDSESRLSLRAPPGSGTANLRIETQGVDVTTIEAYRYFDPYNDDFWSAGDSIEGAVNLTVIDWNTRARIPGAFVMLGTDPETNHQGFTNERGQITFSGPDVYGPQSVTAGKLEYALFSWIDVNAENLTLLPYPYPPPFNPGFDSGPPPPIVRGTIKRLKDEYNLGDDLVLVTTTYESFSIPLPDPGPRSVVVNQGEYEIWARTGDMVVTAYVGVNNYGTLAVHAMGFAPFVSTEVGSGDECSTDADCPEPDRCYNYGDGAMLCTRVYEGVDILVDTPLKQVFEIQLENPPLGEPNGPNTSWSSLYYDFGSMGLLPMPDVFGESELISMNMPADLPGALEHTPFFVTTGVSVGFDDGDPSTPIQLYPPESVVRLPALIHTAEPAVATPMLGTSLEIKPMLGGTIDTPMQFEFSVNKEVEATSYLHVYFLDGQLITWIALGPGWKREFELPMLPEVVAELRFLPNTVEEPHLYYWQMMGMYSPGVDFNHLDPVRLWDWRSQSIYNAYFYAPESP